MHNKYFEIKDSCRKGLVPFLERAIATIPKLEQPKILDAGCGAGVTTLIIAERFPKSLIKAVDLNADALRQLMEKVDALKLNEQVKLFGGSIFNINFKKCLFDIILAEGFLNVVGFEKGFKVLKKLLKTNGFMIIHDTFKYTEFKKDFIKRNGFKILDSFMLDEKVWWNSYYETLEKEIAACQNKETLELFKSDLYEIEQYKANPFRFKSFYYVIERIERYQ